MKKPKFFWTRAFSLYRNWPVTEENSQPATIIKMKSALSNLRKYLSTNPLLVAVGFAIVLTLGVGVAVAVEHNRSIQPTRTDTRPEGSQPRKHQPPADIKPVQPQDEEQAQQTTPAASPSAPVPKPASATPAAAQPMIQSVGGFTANVYCESSTKRVSTGSNLSFYGRYGGAFQWQVEYSVQGVIKVVYSEGAMMPANPPVLSLYRPNGVAPEFAYEGGGLVRVHVTSPNDVVGSWVTVESYEQCGYPY